MTKSIPLEWFEVNAAQTLYDLLIAISTGNQWKFLHSFVGEIYLRMFCESRRLTCASNCFVCYRQDGTLVDYSKNTKEECEEFAKKINHRLPGADFSPLIERVRKKPKSDLLSWGFAKQNFGRSFRAILLSRCMFSKFSFFFAFQNFEKSLAFAQDAHNDLNETVQGFLAQNNLAVWLGYGSQHADTEEKRSLYCARMLDFVTS